MKEYFESLSKAETSSSVAVVLAAQVQKELSTKELDPKYETSFEHAFFPPAKPNKLQAAMENVPNRVQYAEYGACLARFNAKLRIYFSMLQSLMAASPRISQAMMVANTPNALPAMKDLARNLVQQVLAPQLSQLAHIASPVAMNTNALGFALGCTDSLRVYRSDKGYVIDNTPIAFESLSSSDHSWDTFSTPPTEGKRRRTTAVFSLASGGDRNWLVRGSNPDFDTKPSIDDDRVPMDLRQFYFGGFTTEFGKAVENAVVKAHTFLFGSVPSKSNVKSQSVTFALDTDFSMLEDLLVTIPFVGDAIRGAPLFADPVFTKGVISNLGPYFRMGLRRNMIAATARKYMRKITTDNSYDFASLPDFAVKYNSVAFTTGVKIELPDPVVDFMTQGADESARVLLLARWFKQWAPSFMRLPNTKGRVKQDNIPRSLASATQLSSLRTMREKLGFPDQESIGDADGVAISGSGYLIVPPRSSDIDLKKVAEVEAAISAQLSNSFSLGIPTRGAQTALSVEEQYILGCDLTEDQIKGDAITKAMREYESIKGKYRTTVIGVDPATGTVLTTGNDVVSVHTQRTYGSVPATALELSDQLGFDYSRPGDSPVFRTGTTTLSGALWYSTAEDRSLLVSPLSSAVASIISEVTGNRFVERRIPANFLPSSYNPDLIRDGAVSDGRAVYYPALAAVASLYGFMLDNKLVPTIAELMDEAKKMQEAYCSAHGAEAPYIDHDLYTADIATLTPTQQVAFYGAVAITDGFGEAGSRLRNFWIDNSGGSDFTEEMKNDWRYIPEANSVGLHAVANMQSYLGGALLICAARAAFDPSKRKALHEAVQVSGRISAQSLQSVLLPMCYLFGRCLPNVTELFAKTEAHVENLQPTPVTPQDMEVRGSIDHTFMPHQAEAQQKLAKEVPPPYAVLDIAPGGGKTILGVNDILHVQKVSSEPIKSAVIAPAGLVGNWCEDLHLVTHDWNVVPIVTQSAKEWGVERLHDLMSNAPVNTIFVFANSFISNGSIMVDVGGARVRLSPQIEFLRRYKFNYVILDESHKAKSGGVAGRPQSQVHHNIKQFFLQSSIKYKRLATGTLTPDRVSDVIGQAALLTPGIFGDGANLQDAARTDAGGDISDNAAQVFNKLVTAMKARLANYASLVSYKRRSWAFMLPTPIETFLHFTIDDPAYKNSDLHKQAYDSIYAAMAEEALEMAKARKAASGGDADEEDDSDVSTTSDDQDQEDDDDSEVYGDSGESGDLGKMLRSNARLSNYYQRMEQMLTDPMGDVEVVKVFETAGIKDFTAVKVHKIVERVRKHFEVQDKVDDPVPPEDPADMKYFNPDIAQKHQTFKWYSGCRPFELDICVYKGQRYLARKKKLGVAARYRLPESTVTPDKDIEYWKPEIAGKVLILCWYDRSGDAVLAGLKKLAPDLAKKALRFIAKGGGALNAIDRFRNDENVQILIANEQAITEGYNMQAGTRVIRCDTPWSPGVVEQSHARIARPDFNSAVFNEDGKPGDLKREVIFIDWVMTNHTMEVAKVAKIAGKTVQTTIFSEEDNPRYESIRQWAQLTPITYSVETLIDPRFTDYDTYVDPDDVNFQHFIAKNAMLQIDAAEFAEMRQSSAAEMIQIKGQPVDPNAGFRVIPHVPFVPHQRVYDRWGYDLTLFRAWYKEQATVRAWSRMRYEDYRVAFNGLPVLTEWGEGVISGISARNGEQTFEESALIDSEPSFKSVYVLYPDGSKRAIKISRVHIAEAAIADKKLAGKFRAGPTAKAPVGKTADDAARERDTADREARTTERQNRARKENDKTIDEEASTNRSIRRTAEARSTNVKNGRDPNAGLPPMTNTDVRKPDSEIKLPKPQAPKVPRRTPASDPETTLDKKIQVIPTIYNGFLALYVSASDLDYKDLVKSYDFKLFGEYVYIDALYIADYYKILDQLETKFDFDNPTAKRLTDIQTVFEQSGRERFMYPIAYKQRNEVVDFFRVKHRDAQDPNRLKVYPAFLADRIRLMIDLRTNPKARAFAGRKVAGTRKYGEWMHNEGMAITILQNVTSAKALVKKLIKGGYTITNLKALTTELDQIRIRPEADEKKK